MNAPIPLTFSTTVAFRYAIGLGELQGLVFAPKQATLDEFRRIEPTDEHVYFHAMTLQLGSSLVLIQSVVHRWLMQRWRGPKHPLLQSPQFIGSPRTFKHLPLQNRKSGSAVHSRQLPSPHLAVGPHALLHFPQ